MRSISEVERARAAGTRITADMYLYTAGATGLDAAMPPWVQSGGLEEWITHLKDPATRKRVLAEMRKNNPDWENLFRAAGPEGVLLLGFKSEKLKPLMGKTIAQVAKERGVSPEDAAIDLVIEDGSRVEVAYFLMSEENIKRQIALPWVMFNSDADAPAPEGVFLKSNRHPRTYGNFARLLGKYVREEKVIPLEEAIRKLTALPTSVLSTARAEACSNRVTSRTSWSSIRKPCRTMRLSRTRISWRRAWTMCGSMACRRSRTAKRRVPRAAVPCADVPGRVRKAAAAAIPAQRGSKRAGIRFLSPRSVHPQFAFLPQRRAHRVSARRVEGPVDSGV